FTVPEHVQNLPLIGLPVPGPTSIKDLRDAGVRDGTPRAEVWGLPWHSNITFTGLAYTLGGRSLYWGGWAPQLLDSEMASWPAAVRPRRAAGPPRWRRTRVRSRCRRTASWSSPPARSRAPASHSSRSPARKGRSVAT